VVKQAVLHYRDKVRYPQAQQVSQRDAPPGGGFEVLVFIKVRWLRFAFVGGTPLTVTLGLHQFPPGIQHMSNINFKCPKCGHSTFTSKAKVNRYEDFLGSICANCGHKITDDNIKEYAISIARDKINKSLKAIKIK